jgi:hypothetical protein
MRWFIVSGLLLLNGCSAPMWVGAAFGFGASAMNLDTELVKTYLELREPGSTTPAPEAPK